MGPEKNIEYQFMENYQIKYEARHEPVPAYQFRESLLYVDLNMFLKKSKFIYGWNSIKESKHGKNKSRQ